jgi:hypothetical protein
VRRSKEIIVLVVLLVGMIGFILWYVIDRRARNRLPGNPATHGVSGANTGPAAAGNGAPVDLAQHDGQTVDFSSGQAVIKQTPEDKAALDAGLKDIAEATKNVTFEPAKKPAAPANKPGKP